MPPTPKASIRARNPTATTKPPHSCSFSGFRPVSGAPTPPIPENEDFALAFWVLNIIWPAPPCLQPQKRAFAGVLPCLWLPPPPNSRKRAFALGFWVQAVVATIAMPPTLKTSMNAHFQGSALPVSLAATTPQFPKTSLRARFLGSGCHLAAIAMPPTLKMSTNAHFQGSALSLAATTPQFPDPSLHAWLIVSLQVVTQTFNRPGLQTRDKPWVFIGYLIAVM